MSGWSFCGVHTYTHNVIYTIMLSNVSYYVSHSLYLYTVNTRLSAAIRF